jgi:hypothetical protein
VHEERRGGNGKGATVPIHAMKAYRGMEVRRVEV